MSLPNNHLLARLTNEPILAEPSSQEWFQSCLTAVVQHERASAFLESMNAAASAAASDDDDFWNFEGDKAWRRHYRPYVVQNGVLLVPVMGVLLNRFPYQLGSYATGYTYIEKAVVRGLADANVRGIAFVCDSPGGEVAGNFELVDKLTSLRGEKPIRGFASDRAYSAAYNIIAAADSVVMTRSGGVGSIGVVTMHVDYSGMLDRMGLKVTFIYAGKHKVDGNPYEALPAAVKARIQTRINRVYGIFTSMVAANRDMDEAAVRATEAQCYGEDEAIEIGLADSVASFEEAITAFVGELQDENGEADMANGTQTATQVSQDDHNRIVTETKDAAFKAGKAEGLKEGATTERQRIAAIVDSDEGKTRPIAARAAAMDTDMTVDAAKAFLARLPQETASTPAAPPAAATQPAGAAAALFNAAMQQTGNPDVGASPSGDGDKAENVVESIFASAGYGPRRRAS